MSKVAVVQMVSGNDLAVNLSSAETLIGKAVDDGAVKVKDGSNLWPGWSGLNFGDDFFVLAHNC